jgi:hypothetical protein
MSNLGVSAHDVSGWVVGAWGGFFLCFGHDPDVDVLQHYFGISNHQQQL